MGKGREIGRYDRDKNGNPQGYGKHIAIFISRRQCEIHEWECRITWHPHGNSWQVMWQVSWAMSWHDTWHYSWHYSWQEFGFPYLK
jgi:hypothetical protein